MSPAPTFYFGWLRRQLPMTRGDTVALEAVVGCLDCLKVVTVAHGGQVIKTIGDER